MIINTMFEGTNEKHLFGGLVGFEKKTKLIHYRRMRFLFSN